MRIATRGVVRVSVVALCVIGALSACTGTPGAQADGTAGTIALLLPDSHTARYEAFDRPLFENRMNELCPDCTVVYSNADQDATHQQQQAESALTQGIDVMVLDPVNSVAAASIVASAAAEDVPVIAYDRFIESEQLSYYISFDNEAVGTLQGTALVEKMEADGKGDGNIIMLNGSPTDANAASFKEGAHNAIDASGLTILAEFDTPGWSPSQARDWAAGQIVQFGDDIDGVYAANDSTAGGAIAALKADGVSPMPPVTGQDADLAGIQRIIAGDQYMTVYKAIRAEAELAAEVAYALLMGDEIEAQTEVDGIPTTLLDPVAVTVDTIMETVVADGFYTVEEICTPEYADACERAGIE